MKSKPGSFLGGVGFWLYSAEEDGFIELQALDLLE